MKAAIEDAASSALRNNRSGKVSGRAARQMIRIAEDANSTMLTRHCATHIDGEDRQRGAGRSPSLLVRGAAYRSHAECVLMQPQMSAVIMEVADILASKANRVPFSEDDHVVEHFPANAADPSFCDRILPRRMISRSARCCPHQLNERDHGFAEDAVAVEHQVAGVLVVGE